jgi:hypothetical protein
MDDDVRFVQRLNTLSWIFIVLDQTTTLSWIFIVLDHFVLDYHA